MKKIYKKPIITVETVDMANTILADSWGTDGSHTRIVEGDPDENLDLDAKEDGFNDEEDYGFGSIWDD